MKKTFGAVAVLSLAVAAIGAASKTASAQVIVNNVLSPFTSIEVGPGYRYGGRAYYGSYGYPSYYESPGYYGSYGYPGNYYNPGYYGGRRYRESEYYARNYGARHGHCWVTTDRDHNYGYWDWCR
jgi:hypothetical protein